MKLKLSLLLLIVICGNLLAQIKDESITLETKTGEIHGTISCPTSTNKLPIVLIIAGSGPTDRNGNNPMMTNNSLKMLAEGLFENNIASLRYDKRGVAESKEAALNENDLRFECYIEDAKAWVDLLSKDSRFSEIIIAGHSEGSLIGMIASQKKEVAKYISLEGCGYPAGQRIKEQLAGQPPVVLSHSLAIIEKLEKGEKVDTVPQFLYSLFRPSVQPYMISWFKYDPSKEISCLKKPILIIQGTFDIQVSVSDADKLYEANNNSEKHIIEGMNHILKPSEADRMKNIQTYSNPVLPLKDGLISTISIFINKDK